jgi:hypothetical protein
MAYINHFGRRTAKAQFGRWRYELGGNVAMVRGLRKLHGWGATLAVVRELGIAHSREWRKQFPLDDKQYQRKY